MVVQCAPRLFSASVNVAATTSAVSVLISSQVPVSACSALGQFSLPPFDGQQPLGQHPIVVVAFGCSGAQSQPLHGEQDRPVLVEHVEVGLDPGSVGFRHPCVAVAGVAGRTVGAESPDTQRQRQHIFAQALDLRMSRNGLKAGIQQRRVHAVGILLRADLAG